VEVSSQSVLYEAIKLNFILILIPAPSFCIEEISLCLLGLIFYSFVIIIFISVVDFFCGNFHGILLLVKKERWWPFCRTQYSKFELPEMSIHLLLERLPVSNL
jgi:hypothetical protein